MRSREAAGKLRSGSSGLPALAVFARSDRRPIPPKCLREYHPVPSIKRYVIIEQSGVAVTVHSRQGDEPWATTPHRAGNILDLPEIGIQLPVDSLYRDVDSEQGQDLEPNTPL